MQDQPLGGDARDDQDLQMEFYEQLNSDDQAKLSEEMGYIENENDTNVDSTFGESIGDVTSDPFMSDDSLEER
jgi:hypothetical protein